MPRISLAGPLLLVLASPATAQEAMDHNTMDHGTMDMSMPGMDHSAHDMAGMDHGSMAMNGQGSGSSRLPANEPMAGVHLGSGANDMVMVSGYVWPITTHQSGPRGGEKFYAQSAAMVMWMHDFGGAQLTTSAMLSIEPAMRHDGYPILFGSGEVAYGQPLVDRQHPHDLFMELSAKLSVSIAPGTSVFVYGGPVGEPALGPSAFMHRASARYNPEAPITHHWFDSTHITYGVITAGLAGKAWQLEASAFRGREPDEQRWAIEAPKLDSWSVRASFAPSPAWLMQVSYGALKQPEASHPDEDERRFTASAHFNNGKGLSATAGFSAKRRIPGETRTAWLGEANWNITRHHTLFGRIENVANDELFPDEASPLHDQPFRVTKFQAGYAYRLALNGPVQVALGGSVAVFAKPAALDAAYGRNPIGTTIFARFSLGQ